MAGGSEQRKIGTRHYALSTRHQGVSGPWSVVRCKYKNGNKLLQRTTDAAKGELAGGIGQQAADRFCSLSIKHRFFPMPYALCSMPNRNRRCL
jgi:hypothetical protein